MKILFIGFQDLVHPWFDDFGEAIAGRHQVTLFDPSLPIASQFAGKDVIVDQGGWGTREMIDAATSAKLWQIIGTSVNHIDVQYILDKGIPLSHSPGIFSGIALAEHALMLMLCLSKKLRESERNIRSGIFYHPLNHELEGKTLSLVGFGGSGRELAKRARAFGMKLLAIDIVPIPKETQEEYGLAFCGGRQDLDHILREADYLSIHTPWTSQTENMIDRRVLGLLKPTAVLINVARGQIVDEAALLEALRSGRLRGAGLDVFAQEPLDVNHPFLHMDNVIATPHIAGGTQGTSQRRGRAAAENVFRVAQGLPPLCQITSPE